VFAFIVKGFAQTASFRIPESHTFQQTLPLPPITALTGLMGAAIGLSFKDVMSFREQKGILFGVIGSSKGEMKDLWKYNKLETDKKRKKN
jgi:CRISPR-associated protein Cas5t